MVDIHRNWDHYNFRTCFLVGYQGISARGKSMKIFDLARLAVRNLKGRWAVLPTIAFAVATFCLCFSGAILTTVQEEKSQPYELILSAQGSAGVTDSTIADILKIPDVKAATSILQIPVAIQTGEYTAQLTLTGMDTGFLGRRLYSGQHVPR